MKKQELIKKLQDIEWQDFEVKEAKSAVPKNSWETVSAFCNTAGGALVFGAEEVVNRTISDFRVEYLEVMGTSFADAQNRYDYRMPVQKNLYEYYFSIFEKLLKHINIPFKLKGFSRDENQPQVTAIREALVNLLMHTDYFSNAKPRIRVLSDRIEFFNPGSLPKDIKYILKEEFSMPRNNTIARIFRTIKLSENIGSGFYKMFNGWTSYYKRKPKVEGDFDYYKIVFYLDIKQGVEKGVEKIPGIQQIIIDRILKNPAITKRMLQQEGNLTKKAVDYNINKLKEKGLIKRVGPDKGGHWLVVAV